MTISREDSRFWDVRTIERRIRRGQVTRKDYDKFVKSLPDVADKAVPISLRNEPDEDFDDEADEPSTAGL